MLAGTFSFLILPGTQPAEKLCVSGHLSIVLAHDRSKLWLSRSGQSAKPWKPPGAPAAGAPHPDSTSGRRDSQRLAHRRIDGRDLIENIWEVFKPHLPEAAPAGASRVVLEAPP